MIYYLKCTKSSFIPWGRKGSTRVMRLGSHVVVPSPRKKAGTNTNANNELALAA
jgi:hypothetical protein